MYHFKWRHVVSLQLNAMYTDNDINLPSLAMITSTVIGITFMYKSGQIIAIDALTIDIRLISYSEEANDAYF